MDPGQFVKEVLSKCEYPFVWELKKFNVSGNKSNAEAIRKSISELDGQGLWYQEGTQESTKMRSAALHLALAYELGHGQDWTGCLNEMNDCLNWCQSQDHMVKRYKKGIMNVLNPFMAHVHLEIGDVDKAREFINDVEEMENLPKEDQSAVWALKAHCFLEYGEEGWVLALEFVEKALALHPTEAWWHFLVGKLEFRIRHSVHHNFSLRKGPSTKELKAFRTAHAMDPCAVKSLFLASSILEKAQSTGGINNSGYDQAFALFKEVKRMYEESEEYSPRMLIRLGAGFRKLPARLRAGQLAEETLLRALAKAPTNAMVNHQLGLYYKASRKFLLALSYLKVASRESCFIATLSYIELASDMDRDGQGHPESVMEEYAWAEETYLEPSKRRSLHAHAASYHLHVTKDLTQIAHHVSNAIRYSDGKARLRNYSSWWSRGCRVDLIEESSRLLLSGREEWVGRMKEDVETILAEGSGQRGKPGRAAAPPRSNWRPRNNKRRNKDTKGRDTPATLAETLLKLNLEK